MKEKLFTYLATAMMLLSLPVFSQNKDQSKDSLPLLGLAGDNLDLYAVLDIFQSSKTIEEFEKSLNDDKKKINNLDLNLDKKVDFIKVVTKKDGDSYQFILRVDVNKNESQDVAVILLDRDKDKKISMQIVGDEELYGKDYVIEPKGNSSVTPNPGYVGDNPVTVTVPASTTTVQVVQSAPIVQYVYSPAYVPYYPPYYYGFYPAWFGFATVMAVGIYRSNHWYGGYGGYYGGHYHGGNNNIIINNGNRNNFNNYNNNKMRSTTVSDNRARGNYGDGAGANRRNNPSVSNRQSSGLSNRQSPSVSNRQPSVSNRQSPSVSNRQSSPSTRQTPSATNRSSGLSSSSSGFGGGGGRSMSSGGGRSMGGGGRSMGGGRRG